MALPQLSDEQRREALAKAMETRKARALFMAKVKSGEYTVESALDAPLAQRVRVKSFIIALPGYGKCKADSLMKFLGIPENRRIGGLGCKQKLRLIEELHIGGVR